MAKTSKQKSEEAAAEAATEEQAQPEADAAAPEPGGMPSEDAEFVFESVAAMPDWADKGWVGTDGANPILHVPQATTGDGSTVLRIAAIGDTVKWDAKAERFSVEKAKKPEDAPAEPA